MAHGRNRGSKLTEPEVSAASQRLDVIRVLELAKKLGLTDKETVDLSDDLEIGVKSHASAIEDPQRKTSVKPATVGGKPAPTARHTVTAGRGRVRSSTWGPQERARFVTEVAGGTRKAAALLGVAASQPSRWVTGESVPGPGQARMLVDLDHVLAHALLVWADAGVVRDWLTTANAHLDGLCPVDWIRLHGTAEVVEALRAEAAGAYA